MKDNAHTATHTHTSSMAISDFPMTKYKTINKMQ